MKTKKKFKTRDLTVIAMLGAICCVLMHIDFPLPFMPPFMNFDLCGLVELIGGFAMGPLQAFFIIVVKLLLKLGTEGTTSAFTGELQNLMLSCAYVLPPVILYHRNKTKKTAMVGMAAGTIFCSVVAVFTNLFIIIPFYMTLMGQEMGYFIQMCADANPLVQNAATLAIFGIVPFNLIKCSINSLGAMVLYKRLSPLLHGYGYTTYPAAKVQEADA